MMLRSTQMTLKAQKQMQAQPLCRRMTEEQEMNEKTILSRVTDKITNEWQTYFLKTTGSSQSNVFAESEEISMKRRIARILLYRVKSMSDKDLARLYFYNGLIDMIYSSVVNDVGKDMDGFVEGKVEESILLQFCSDVVK